MLALACLVKLEPKANGESQGHRAHLADLGTLGRKASRASMASQARMAHQAKMASQASKVLGVHQERRVSRAILVMR